MLGSDHYPLASLGGFVQTTTGDYTAEIQRVLNSQEVVELQGLIRKVPVADHVIDFAVGLVRKTRPTAPDASSYIKEQVSWGAGPRASRYLILAAKARAVLDGRYAASIGDVRSAAVPVLRHRVITSFNAEAEGISAVDVINRLMEET